MITLGMADDIRWEPVTVFSVGEKTNEFSRWLIEMNIPYKQLQGCCFENADGADGVETSFLVLARDFDLIQTFSPSWLEGQDSVLQLGPQGPHKHGRRHAMLVPIDLRAPARDLGLWTSVNRSEALKAPYWTYDPATHDYWITKDAPGPHAPTPLMWRDLLAFEGNISDL